MITEGKGTLQVPELRTDHYSTDKITFTRHEIFTALGFDIRDAYYVTLEDFGRRGITFLLDDGKAVKYAKEADEDPER